MTSELIHTNEQSQTGTRSTQWHLGPALGLLAFLAPLYGGGALLIRESGRRWRLGWPGMIVLCFAYGLIEEAFVTQSLFNPNYVGLRLPWPAPMNRSSPGSMW